MTEDASRLLLLRPHRVVAATGRQRADLVGHRHSTRSAAALKVWADQVDPADLSTRDTAPLRSIAELADRREQVDDELSEAVRATRATQRSWAEIGAMLGVSKQAAQRKYGNKATVER